MPNPFNLRNIRDRGNGVTAGGGRWQAGAGGETPPLRLID